MMSAVTEAFIGNYTEIMLGTFDYELLDVSPANRIAKTLKKLAKEHIFTSKDILSLEVSGHKIINELLENFISAVLSDSCEDTQTKEGKLYSFNKAQIKHYNEIIMGENEIMRELQCI
jgi:dGTP triphosphohydrolase